MDNQGIASSVIDTSASGRSSTLSINEVFDVLGHQYRRYVLYYLTRCEYAVGVDELIEQILIWDGGTSSDRRQQISTVLDGIHLPKLADAGAIEYDPLSQLATRAEGTAILDPYLKLTAHDDRVEGQPG